MVDYNDFALPSLENLNLMNKEFQNKIKVGSSINRSDALTVFISIHTMFYASLFIYKENKNIRNLNLYNKFSAIKLIVDGEFLDFKFKECKYIKSYNVTKLFFNEYIKIIEVLLNNNTNKFLLKLVYELNDIAKLIYN